MKLVERENEILRTIRRLEEENLDFIVVGRVSSSVMEDQFETAAFLVWCSLNKL